MTPQATQLTLAEVARTPASAPPPLAPVVTPPSLHARHRRPEQLLVAVCDVCRTPLSYKGTGRYRITCPLAACQLEHRRRRSAAAATKRSSLP